MVWAQSAIEPSDDGGNGIGNGSGNGVVAVVEQIVVHVRGVAVTNADPKPTSIPTPTDQMQTSHGSAPRAGVALAAQAAPGAEGTRHGDDPGYHLTFVQAFQVLF